MTVRCVFRVDLARPVPVSPATDTGEILRFDIERDGTKISIIPEVQERVENFDVDGEQIPQRETMLTAIRAEVARECNAGALTREVYQSLRTPTVEVLGSTLAHIRDLTRCWGVEVRPAITLALYRDSSGHVYRRPFPFWVTTETGILMDFIDISPLTAMEWQRVETRVKSSEGTTLARDWFFEARTSLDAGDLSMALIGAAVASEIALHRLLERERTNGNRLSPAAGKRRARPMSNHELALELVRLDVIDGTLAEASAAMFRTRNDIIHGNPRPPVSFDEAWSAINVARSMRDLLG